MRSFPTYNNQQGTVSTPTRIINKFKMSEPLEWVAINGNLSMLRSLVEEHNYDPKQKGTNESTLLHCACLGGNLDMVKYLIDEHHLDPLFENDVDKTPLSFACEAGHLDIVRYLVDEQSVDPNYSGSSSLSPCSLWEGAPKNSKISNRGEGM